MLPAALVPAVVTRPEPCGRCHGTVVLSEDTYGRYWRCLRCGETFDLPQAPRRRRRSAPKAPANKRGPFV